MKNVFCPVCGTKQHYVVEEAKLSFYSLMSKVKVENDLKSTYDRDTFSLEVVCDNCNSKVSFDVVVEVEANVSIGVERYKVVGSENYVDVFETFDHS